MNQIRRCIEVKKKFISAKTYLRLCSKAHPFDLKMTTFGTLKQGGGVLEMALRQPLVFFGAGLLFEVSK